MTVEPEALIGGSILAFWGLALVVSGLALSALRTSLSRRRTGMGKAGMVLSGTGVACMLLGFHVMGGA